MPVETFVHTQQGGMVITGPMAIAQMALIANATAAVSK